MISVSVLVKYVTDAEEIKHFRQTGCRSLGPFALHDFLIFFVVIVIYTKN